MLLKFGIPTMFAWLIRLEKVQRRITKRLPGLQNTPYGDRLIFLNSVSLELRRLHLDLPFLYKLIHGSFDIDCENFFEFKSDRTRGHSWALVSKHCNKDLKRFSFSQRLVNIWNFLSETIVSAPSIPAFKKSLHSIDLTLRGLGLGIWIDIGGFPLPRSSTVVSVVPLLLLTTILGLWNIDES